jgi:hypothetical protein
MRFRIHSRNYHLDPPSAGITFVDEPELEAVKARLRDEGYQIVTVAVASAPSGVIDK